MSGLAQLGAFVADLSALLDRTDDETAILRQGAALLRDLVARDDWLPDSHARPDPDHYTQYLLHRDPAGRFSVVSFVWGPGQRTPIHDHKVWGLIGMLRGAEEAERFAVETGGLRLLGRERLRLGQVDAVSLHIGDVHRVANAFDDRVSISIHVYGADIGAVERSVYRENGEVRRFVSGYADAPPLDLTELPA